MKKRYVWLRMAPAFALVLLGGLLLAGCSPELRVGALQTESRSVELGDARSARVRIEMGSGDLEVKGGAQQLLEAAFAYNVARLKPAVGYTNGTLVVRQPGTSGFPALGSIKEFRNEWDLRLNDAVPMNLSVDVGSGVSDLQLVGLSLTGLDVTLGAGKSTIDLSGRLERNLQVTIDAGAASVTVRLPKEVGVRVEVDDGPHIVRAPGLAKSGGAYTNAAYGVSKVTLQVDVEMGIGQLTLEEHGAAAAAPAAAPVGQEQQGQPGPANAAPVLLDPALGKRLQAALDASVASPDTKWPGAVLHVRAPGLGAWSGAAGLGEVATKTATRPNDRFRAGSLTKPFVSAVVLQLVEEGRFGLDDKIDKLLPGKVGDRFADTARISVRMLLNHTSGLPEFYDAAGPAIMADLNKVWDVEEFLDIAATQQPFFAPGESQHYTNTNYLLLGLIIEQATGRSWREAVRQRIIEPLGLKDTLLPAPGDKRLPGEHAHGYADFGSGPFDATELVTASVVGAAGGQTLVTNAGDLATFIEALLAGQLFQHSSTLEQMLTFLKVSAEEFPAGNPVSTIATGYGLGLMRATYAGDVTGIGHTGDTDGGYHGFVFHFPKQKITISGAVNAVDDLAGWVQLMPRVLEVLVPGYTMPKPGTDEAAKAGAALQGLLDDQVQKEGILGMAMAVRMADGTVISRTSGYIDPAKKSPWTIDVISKLGSVTKTYTAVVIMQLVREGKLSLDDTIDRWFPDQPNGDRITVRMLLSHTSGLSEYITPENQNDPKWTREFAPMDAVAEANRLGPVDTPGASVAHYANTNYFVLGLIIEAITGNSWEQAVRSRIIEPLHLEHTAFVTDKGIKERLVEGYFKTPKGYVPTRDVPNFPSASTAWANGGIVSSLADLMTFAGALFDGTLVPEETLAVMGTPVAEDPDGVRLWSLGGAAIKTIPGSFGMGGDAEAYHSFFAGIQGTKYLVAALVNTAEGDVITPSFMALEYMRSLSPAGQ